MRIFVSSIITAITLFFVACGGSKKETVADYSNLFGMWVLQEPQRDAKWEVMFNEDSTGFIFVDDAYRCGIVWQPGDSCIDVKFQFNSQGANYSIPKKFRTIIDADTLILQDVDSVGAVKVTERYIRYKHN